MTDISVAPATEVGGEVRVGGDKSISHRAVILGAMARGRSYVGNLSASADVAATMRCVEACGGSVRPFGEDGRVGLDGAGPGVSLHSPAAALDCANSGTTMRLLAGVLAGHDVEATLDGDASLRRRPMERIAGPLRAMGAEVATNSGGTAPMTVRGRRPLKAVDHRLEVASAQVKSAILLAGLSAEGPTTVTEPVPTRDHTERLLRLCGIEVTNDGSSIRMIPGALQPFGITVPGDISSATAFMVLAACRRGSSITLPSIGVNPGRTGVLDILRAMGAEIGVDDEQPAGGVEPVATVTVTGGDMVATVIAGNAIPRCIDELPLLALAATQAEGITEIRDAAELRTKESDRIARLLTGLRALGAECEERPDGMVITGPSRLHGGRVDSHGDHRLAMTWAIAGCIASQPVTIVGADTVAVSYPRFFTDLASVVR